MKRYPTVSRRRSRDSNGQADLPALRLPLISGVSTLTGAKPEGENQDFAGSAGLPFEFEGRQYHAALQVILDGVSKSDEPYFASRRAGCSIISSAIHKLSCCSKIDKDLIRNSNSPIEEILSTTCAESISEANACLNARSEPWQWDKYRTTALLAIVLNTGDACVGWIGDTCAWHYKSSGRLERLTKPHSRIQELLDDGDITEEEAMHHPDRGIITRALGVCEFVQVDVCSLTLLPGEAVLSATDGVGETLREERLRIILQRHRNSLMSTEGAQTLAERLTVGAIRAGSRDNVSAGIIVAGDINPRPFAVRRSVHEEETRRNLA